MQIKAFPFMLNSGLTNESSSVQHTKYMEYPLEPSISPAATAKV